MDGWNEISDLAYKLLSSMIYTVLRMHILPSPRGGSLTSRLFHLFSGWQMMQLAMANVSRQIMINCLRVLQV